MIYGQRTEFSIHIPDERCGLFEDIMDDWEPNLISSSSSRSPLEVLDSFWTGLIGERPDEAALPVGKLSRR